MLDYTEMLMELNKKYNFNTANDIVITEVGNGISRVQTALSPKSLNPFGFAHGGLLFTLCDVAAGVLALEGGRASVTLSANIEYLRGGISSGTLYAVAKRIKEGRTIGVFDVDVYDENDNLLAKSTMQYYYSGLPLTLAENSNE